MSFPQPKSNEYAQNGAAFFRLNTLLASAGDMYESEQGCHAFALGPESDISRVNINYYDDQVPNFVNQIQISNQRAFVGRIDARNTNQYQPSNRPGRILIWPDELFDDDYRPVGFNPVSDNIIFMTPRLDVIQYFTPQTSLASQRVNKEYRFQNLTFPLGILSLAIPAYGRRLTTWAIQNFTNPNGQVNIRILGVNFAISDNAVNAMDQETELLVLTAVTGTLVKGVIKASVVGFFDMIIFQVDLDAPAVSPGPIVLKIATSDNEA